MVRVDLESLLGKHVAGLLLLVLESLGLVHSFHACRVSVLRSKDEQRIVFKLVRNLNFFDIPSEELFPPVGQRFVHLFQLLELLFGSFIVAVDKGDIVFRDGLELPFLVFGQVLSAELVDRVSKE